jgi:hypothetical protein
MVAQEELRRALLGAEVRAEHGAYAMLLERYLSGITLTPSRVSGMLNSVAWHATRTRPEQRLAAVDDELKRLQRQSAGSLDQPLYSWLRARLRGQIQAEQEKPRLRTEEQLLKPLSLHPDEQAVWLVELRVLRMQTLLQLVELLTRSEALRDALALRKGRLQWD